MAGMATVIEARRLPVLCIYSEDDKLVDTEASVEYAELFGVTSQLTRSYGENGMPPCDAVDDTGNDVYCI
jgi:hypothetical protein